VKVRGLRRSKPAPGQPSLRIPTRSAPLSVNRGIWGDTPQAPRAGAAPPRPLLHAGIHYGGGQMGEKFHDVEVAARHPFGLLRLNDFKDSWGDTPPRAWPFDQAQRAAAPPRPLPLAGIRHGRGRKGSEDHDVEVAARHPFGPAPGATHPCRAAPLRKNEKGFGEGTPLALPAHGPSTRLRVQLRPRDTCFSLILQGVG